MYSSKEIEGMRREKKKSFFMKEVLCLFSWIISFRTLAMEVINFGRDIVDLSKSTDSVSEIVIVVSFE